MTELAELEAERNKLVARLSQGWELVGPGREGENDSRLHDHFEKVLREYEEVCDELALLAA